MDWEKVVASLYHQRDDLLIAVGDHQVVPSDKRRDYRQRAMILEGFGNALRAGLTPGKQGPDAPELEQQKGQKE